MSNMPEKTDKGKHKDIPHYSLISAVTGTQAQEAGNRGSHYSAARRDLHESLENPEFL